MRNDLSYEVIKLRHSCNITQSMLADKCAVSRATIACIELGSRDPSMDTLRRIADAANLTLQIRFVPKS